MVNNILFRAILLLRIVFHWQAEKGRAQYSINDDIDAARVTIIARRALAFTVDNTKRKSSITQLILKIWRSSNTAWSIRHVVSRRVCFKD